MYRYSRFDLYLDTSYVPVVFARADDPLFKDLGFYVGDRVMLSCGVHNVYAILHAIDSKLLPEKNLSICTSLQKDWCACAHKDNIIFVGKYSARESLSCIKKKIDKEQLDLAEFNRIIIDIKDRRLIDLHITAFLTACASNPLNEKETVFLTKAMVGAGEIIKWSYPMIVDKHCVGGLPGNRTTPIITAIVAAYGLKMPKTSSRAITSPAGTADTMSVITNVETSIETMKKIVDKENACLVWGGVANLSPVDDMLIRVERSIGINVDSQLIASILSKKIAAGATHLLIDIPIGPEIKITSHKEAQALREYFNYVARKLDIKIEIIFSSGLEPLGYGIGPSLEMKDVMRVLSCDKDAPQDLMEKSLLMAGLMLEFDQDRVKKGQGYLIAKELLFSKAALKKFINICKAQGDFRPDIRDAHFKKDIRAENNATLGKLSNKCLTKLANILGAPQSLFSGIYLHKKVGDEILMGEKIMTLYSDSELALEGAEEYMQTHTTHYF